MALYFGRPKRSHGQMLMTLVSRNWCGRDSVLLQVVGLYLKATDFRITYYAFWQEKKYSDALHLSDCGKKTLMTIKVTLGKPLNLSKPYFLHLSNEHSTICFTNFLRRRNNIIHLLNTYLLSPYHGHTLAHGDSTENKLDKNPCSQRLFVRRRQTINDR